jgi:hypothetical protein
VALLGLGRSRGFFYGGEATKKALDKIPLITTLRPIGIARRLDIPVELEGSASAQRPAFISRLSAAI